MAVCLQDSDLARQTNLFVLNRMEVVTEQRNFDTWRWKPETRGNGFCASRM